MRVSSQQVRLAGQERIWGALLKAELLQHVLIAMQCELSTPMSAGQVRESYQVE